MSLARHACAGLESAVRCAWLRAVAIASGSRSDGGGSGLIRAHQIRAHHELICAHQCSSVLISAHQSSS
eukprot:3852162-Prymnesium_polylepis.1